MQRDEIYAAISAERAAQDAKWGGPEHDRTHNAWDWSNYITKFHGKFIEAIMDAYDYNPPESGGRKTILTEARKHLTQLAALCVAALENAPDLQLPAPASAPEAQGDTP